MKILAVDVHGVCRPKWEIYQKGRITDGEPFADAVDRIKRAAEGFDRVVLALDVGPSFRKLHCPTYKQSREDPGEAYRRMVEDVTRRLVADGATVFPNKGEKAKMGIDAASHGAGSAIYYPEADDILASLVAWYHRQIDCDDPEASHLRILSGDTDTWALIDDAARIDVEPVQAWRSKNFSDRGYATEADVRERFGGVGSWVTEVKALAGDDSDEYKPFPHYDPTKKGGIAEGKAAKLLSQYGSPIEAVVNDFSAENVFYRAMLSDGDEQQMPDSHERKCLRAGGQKALDMGYVCARMRTDLPLEFSRILAEPKVEPIVAKPKDTAGAPASPPKDRALTRYSPPSTDLLDPNALQPQSLADLFEVGNMVVNSRVYPHIDCPEKAMVVIAEARERRIPYATALRNAYFVKGRLSWSAAFISGLVLRSGVCDVFEISESTTTYAVVDFQRRGRPLRQFRYDLAEAEQAGWLRRGDNGDSRWITNPRVMLRWAALREAARAFFPDCVSGMYTPDELRDGHVLDAEFEQTEAEFER